MISEQKLLEEIKERMSLIEPPDKTTSFEYEQLWVCCRALIKQVERLLKTRND